MYKHNLARLKWKNMQKSKSSKLNPKREKFCQLYVNGDKEFFGNGTQAYIEAYSIDLSRKGAYQGARASAHKLLTSANIMARISELLNDMDGGLNDENITKQHLFNINQFGDLSVKQRAIECYYKLKRKFDIETSQTVNTTIINGLTVQNMTPEELMQKLQEKLLGCKR